MKRFYLLFVLLAIFACSKPKPQDFHVIPMPDQVTLTDGVFNVKGMAVNFDENMDEASLCASLRFVDALETASG